MMEIGGRRKKEEAAVSQVIDRVTMDSLGY
jgi:hypothetical protein